MAEQGNAFLGRGFKFPIQVDESTGRMKTSSYEEDIKESIYIILMTKKGERIRNPQFGCGIFNFAFGTMDYTSLNEMKEEVEEALLLWEPRIKDVEVELDTSQEDTGCLLIQISYVVRTTNNPYNLVYPFYLDEGFMDQMNIR